MSSEPTIIALSTPPGLGALAILRLSGPRSLDIFYQLTKPPARLIPRIAQNLYLFDESDILDNVVATFFKAPVSYTGEDLVEISCHGSPYIINRIVELCNRRGAVLAQPGEFTRRAFINGKIDLTQAEAVADLVFAQTQSAHRAAMQLLEGSIGREIKSLRNEIIDLISILELELDFSENEINQLSPQELSEKLTNILKNNNKLLASYSCGKILKQGALVPIIGPPNSGKSSLLNAFLNEKRAIVTQYPGTTRDSLEETIRADGYMLRLLDTAGLRKTKNPIEIIGIKRTLESIRRADVVLFVVDVTKPIKREWKDYYKNAIIVINKIDLATNDNIQKYRKQFAKQTSVLVSAKKRLGINDITKQIVKIIASLTEPNDSLVITNQRHAQNLRAARGFLLTTKKHLKYNLSPEIIIADLRQALDEYDKILGGHSTDEILDNIFKNFCIGK